MPTLDVKIACQRCGEPMTMTDPGPGDAWRPDQYWVCLKCGRHFWSAYPDPSAPAVAPKPAPATPAPTTAPATKT